MSEKPRVTIEDIMREYGVSKAEAEKALAVLNAPTEHWDRLDENDEPIMPGPSPT